MTSKREILDTWFAEVWDRGNTAHIYEAAHADVATIGHRGDVLRGPEEFEVFQRLIRSLITDISIKITRFVESDDWTAMTYIVSGQKPGTERPIEIVGSSFMRFKDGLIYEVHEHVDFISMFIQTGALPEGTLEHCLNGGGLQVLSA